MGRSLQEVRATIEAAWSLETCDPVDVPEWSRDNPARGQCGATALVVHDLLGGELLVAEVHFLDGSRQGFHYWNRLPDGEEVDLTSGQFSSDEIVQPPRRLRRPPGAPVRCAAQYELLRDRVVVALCRDDGEVSSTSEPTDRLGGAT